MKKTLLFFCVTLAGGALQAQIERMETDRPDQTESPFLTPKKWIQFEMGFSKETDKQFGYKKLFFQHPTLLSKYGISEKFELRLITEFNSYKEQGSNTSWKNGIRGFELGGKVALLKEKKLLPQTSLIAHYSVGTGSSRKHGMDTADGFNFRFVMQHTVSDIVSISYNVGMEWNRFIETPAYIYTFAPGFNMGEKWYGYLELFGFIYKGGGSQHSADAGLAYYVSDNLKLDISAGIGINKNAPDHYYAIGASWRFNTKP